MGKVKQLFVCANCERPSAQWSGRCSSCGGWGTVSEHPSGSTARAGQPLPTVLTLAPDPEERRISTGFHGVDRVLGGGLVPASVVLLTGAPGIGKSTLLLQLASRLTEAGHPCLLASGEEARGQVAGRARRLGLDGSAVSYLPGREVSSVLAATRSGRPHVLIVDSIQTLRDGGATGLPGGVAQVRACADALVSMAKEEGVTVLLVGHVTKGGDLAGPRTLEHAVDSVLSFEGDARSGLRTLTAGKNRYGPEGEIAWFEMVSTGLIETEAGPAPVSAREAGCAIGMALAGRRAFGAEIQALVVPTEGPPRRQVSGLDPRRFHILAAVVDGSLGLRLSRCELFGASAGGVRLDDPGVDLAVAAALASSSGGRAPPPGRAFVGEVSLTGTIRPVAGMEARLSAASAAGMKEVVIAARPPASSIRSAMRLIESDHLRGALSWAMPR